MKIDKFQEISEKGSNFCQKLENIKYDSLTLSHDSNTLEL